MIAPCLVGIDARSCGAHRALSNGRASAAGWAEPRRAITTRAITVRTAGAIVVRLAAAPVTTPSVFNWLTVAVTIPYRQRAEQHAGRTPCAEVHERHGDEPDAVGEVLLEGAELERQGGAAETGERVADEDRDGPRAGDADTEAVRGLRGLADGAHVETEPGVVDEERHRRHQQQGQVDHQTVLEEHLADVLDVAEHGDLHLGEALDRPRRADFLPVDQLREAESEQVDADAADPLFGLEHQRHDGVHAPHHDARQTAGDHAFQKAPGLEHGPVGKERAEEHDTVDAEVEHAAALTERLAQRGEKVRRGQAKARRRPWRRAPMP